MPEDGSIALKGFEDLDGTKEVAAYIQALESFDALRELQELKRLARRRVKPGDRVLDVGCGFGLETFRLAKIAGDGLVSGIDKSGNFIEEARRRAEAQSLKIEFRAGDAEALPYASASFDAVRAERVLIYLDEPEMALSEMRRVAKPGASVAVIEPDFGTNTINIPDRSLTRRILAHECDTAVQHGWLVRDVKTMLADLGFKEVRIATRMVVFTPDLALGYFTKTGQSAAKGGVISESELATWTDAIAERHAASRLFAAIGYYLFMART